jgi:hypothetical protein
MWLDFAEDQAKRHADILRDWQTKLDQFLQFNDRDVLEGAGKITRKRLMKRPLKNTLSLKKAAPAERSRKERYHRLSKMG